MRKCPYCNRWFKNRQALIAHLKYCPVKHALKTQNNFENFERLLLELLKVLPKIKLPEKSIKARHVANWLKIDFETANNFLRWLISSEYYTAIRMLLKALKNLEYPVTKSI